MRFIGFLGIFALILVNILGFVLTWHERDLKGLALMLFMAVMLAFFAFILWRGARLERGADQGMLAVGWAGQPVGSFFRSVVARSREGGIFLVGAAASVIFAVLSFLCPDVVGISPARASAHAVLFGIWPVTSFVWYVKVCGPTFKPSALNSILVLLGAGFPFYLAYG
ncbi:MAG: hypothetical protein LBE81_00885 [Azonexus sp.]|jgi:hypothetical protein|uniref:hypothetical protein n=1 Tax=Azonexus sp. TaxID=1872668 RepID=UPI002821F9E3|nr:hypothetical protein [Azonexus sp.]MDR0775182.1 hypothetical protein [Azonexus sp.]